ncbi:MAG: YCII-related domain protein [Sphingobacteriales bacterium]|nr:YCII-related domain protein [Sphingobacteriales bacterium]
MSTEKKQYFLKLNPPRPTFIHDMTDGERAIMQEHTAYWAPYVDNGTVLVLGPVFDPKGGYGICIVEVESESELALLMADDPASGLGNYEFYPMAAVRKTQN